LDRSRRHDRRPGSNQAGTDPHRHDEEDARFSSQTESGKWSQSGKTITVIDSKGKSEKMTLSADGKHMVMTPPVGDRGPKGMKLVFNRG
jgi:hypothetical protein